MHNASVAYISRLLPSNLQFVVATDALCMHDDVLLKIDFEDIFDFP